jgi:hypothetical protein
MDIDSANAEKAALRFNRRLGDRLERLRLGREPGYTVVDREKILQEEVAARARSIGLKGWNRSTVAAIERGGRTLFPVELALLPSILGDLGCARTDGARLTVSDLLAANDVRAWIEHEQQRNRPRPLPPLFRRWTERIARRAQGLVPGLTVEGTVLLASKRRQDLDAWAMEDAIVKAAPSLGVPSIALALAGWVKWGHGLTQEREARLKVTGLSAREIQAVRGHLTRKLLEELTPLLAGVTNASKKGRTRR